MNTPLRRLATVVVGMFVVLMGGATWVQFVQADALNNDGRNVRTLYREFGRARGPIVVAGEAVASSAPVDDAFKYQRSYANGELYAPVTGFYSIVHRGTMLEGAENDVLNGQADSLFLSRLQDLITGKQPQGSSIELTLNPAAQQAAWDALGDQRGAVVALDPSTGAILALVSKPSYDPNQLTTHDSAAANAAYQALLAAEGDPLENKAIQGPTYPPGSTFKLVTAAAALESGRATPESLLTAPDELPLPQTSATVKNYGGSSCGSGGQTTLADALRVSCNTAFAQLGLDLGADALREQADKFGFDDDEQYVPMKVAPSRFPDEVNAPNTAFSALGQYSVTATPLQMAMVSAAIANEGELMEPYLVQTVRTADLDVVREADPSRLSQAVSPTTAAALRDMMVGVVENGSGKAAKIPGVQVAGKTGTAQTGREDESPHAWFTSFAPADAPRVAVAVVVENGGAVGNEATGGKVAAPIAKAVIEAVLAQ
ncbi:peptidoglycan D,D-transpeptidase FtsI family protein [Cellulomonas sp. NPDC055163]